MSNLLGVLFAVLIATMAIPKIVTWQSFETDNKVMAITAQEQKTFDTAVSGYVQENAIAIQAAATATVPATITVAMLQATNFLRTSFSPTNPYGQTWEAQVLEPLAGNLQVLAISKGGQTLSDTQVNRISMSVPNGGFIPQNDGGAYPTATANAIGARASWNVATAGYANITGGHLAALFNFNQGQLTSNYLYRNAVPGQPQLNQMNTPLVMAAVETSGLACTPLGAIARDTTGGLLSCPASGLWQTVGGGSWKAPVSSFAALPVVSNTVGDVRLTTDFNRAYAWNGAAWNALAIDKNGDMNVPGTVTMANAVITGTATIGGGCSPNGKIAQNGTGLILSCQSGVWRKATGGGGTGVSGILMPLAGMQISCSYVVIFGRFGVTVGLYAKVDASGMPFTRVTESEGFDSGWVSGYRASVWSDFFVAQWGAPIGNLTTTTTRLNGGPGCTASWPMR